MYAPAAFYGRSKAFYLHLPPVMALVDSLLQHPLIRRYTSLVHADLSATYSRQLHKWLIIAPIIGVIVGLFITLITQIILEWMWPLVHAMYMGNPWTLVPGLVFGFVVAGLIMQYLTPDPDEHSTEEIIHSYHHHEGHIEGRPFVPKIVAAIASVGMGASAALEGPSIYGGGAIGSYVWAYLRRFSFFKLTARDRRIMLICGAAAGMSAVFRAPLTGVVFALEMPYKDDLAHEALLPSLISSAVSYVTMAAFIGAEPLFKFGILSEASYTRVDLMWCALLGVICGLLAMAFAITFRRFRKFSILANIPHWLKMAIGGGMTGVVGGIFYWLYPNTLIPVGLNYEAVTEVLVGGYGTGFLLAFAFFKLTATLFSLGTGGVSAMFVPLFLSGGAIGVAYAQSVVGSPALGLYAAVGMASFIAGGYKVPLTAVVFIAEAAGGHGFIVPAFVGAAAAYAVSGEATASADQRLHEGLKLSELDALPVREIMQPDVVSVDADATLRAFADDIAASRPHNIYPVMEAGAVVGSLELRSLTRVSPSDWDDILVRDAMDSRAARISPETDVSEALRRLNMQDARHLLWVAAPDGSIQGIVTKSNVLAALAMRRAAEPSTLAQEDPAHAPRSIYDA